MSDDEKALLWHIRLMCGSDDEDAVREIIEQRDKVHQARIQSARQFCALYRWHEAVKAERDAALERERRLRTTLERARDAIASLPDDALGTGGDGLVVPFYPIRDELVDAATKALADEPEPSGGLGLIH